MFYAVKGEGDNISAKDKLKKRLFLGPNFADTPACWDLGEGVDNVSTQISWHISWKVLCIPVSILCPVGKVAYAQLFTAAGCATCGTLSATFSGAFGT